MTFHAGRAIPSLPLHQEASDISDYTVDSTSTFVDSPPATVPTPGSPVHHRPGYRRVASLSGQDTAYHGPERSPNRLEDLHEQGLGIKNLKPLPSASPGGRSSPSTPASGNPLLSPQTTRLQNAYRSWDDDPLSEGNEDWDENVPRIQPFQPFVADAETESLRKHTPAPTVESFEPPGTSNCLLRFWRLVIVVKLNMGLFTNLGLAVRSLLIFFPSTSIREYW